MPKKTVEERLGALDLSVQATNGLVREMRDQLNDQNGHLSEVTDDVRELQLEEARRKARREERERLKVQAEQQGDREAERSFWAQSGAIKGVMVAVGVATVVATVAGQLIDKAWPG